MSLENVYEGLTDEQMKRARSCKTPEEMLEFAKDEGIELTDEQVEAIAAGGIWDNNCRYCPKDSDAWS